jgi:hypothetical protein
MQMQNDAGHSSGFYEAAMCGIGLLHVFAPTCPIALGAGRAIFGRLRDGVVGISNQAIVGKYHQIGCNRGAI